ncbi:MAG: DGQHR domain-containing protein [Deltaproteobacteria bacterium]|nr:DGQHR domain-containing protein [Deltaproteobacteria bacterium]
MGNIFLPGLRGVIGDWTYYVSVIKIKEVVNRIIAVSDSKELYTENINEILQRSLNSARLKSISEYLLTSNERFFNSLVVAIHKGDPKWYDFDIEERFKEEDFIKEDDINFIENKMGVLQLSGNEEIFALDGQHRLKGLEKAYKESKKIGEEELSLIFLAHKQNKKERTRRLFTVLNKYAEKPKDAELIILDEDDAAHIVTRKIVSEHKIFQFVNTLSKSKTGNIASTDLKSFTTLVTVNKIHKILFKKPPNYYKIRPSDSEIEALYNIAKKFWDYFFEKFPEIIAFINGNSPMLNNIPFNRNNENGGSLLLRPIGQEYFAKTYKYFEDKNEFSIFDNNIKKIDFYLNSNTWKYIFWNGTMLLKDNKLKYKLFLYLLGEASETDWINQKLTSIYAEANQTYNNHIKPVITNDAN